MFDPDQHSDHADKFKEMDATLAHLQDCDLSAWDQDFIDDLTKRFNKLGASIHLTSRQWEQLERIKEKHHGES